jgi:hypothetical protein
VRTSLALSPLDVAMYRDGVGDSLDRDRQQRLIDEYIEELP